MKPLIYIIVYATLIYCAKSQDIQWQKSFGGTAKDRAFSIQLTTDGGYVVTGYSFSDDGDVGENQGRSDLWVLKLDDLGDIEWKKSYGGSNWDESYAIQQATDGGYIIAGLTYSVDGDISNNRGGADYWILKLDAKGEIEWQKLYGGSENDIANAILPASGGGYIVSGYSESTDGNVTGNHNGYDYWVVKLREDGEIEWENSYGGSEDDRSKAIVGTSDGGYVIAGESQSSDGDVSMNFGEKDIWIIKIDSFGNIEWESSFGGSDEDFPASVNLTSDGGYIVSGGTKSIDNNIENNGWQDAWVIKLDNQGNLVWQQAYGGSKSDYFNCIHQTDDGGYVATGASASYNIDFDNPDLWIVRLSETGEMKSMKIFGGSHRDWAYTIKETNDGGYITAGFSSSKDGDVLGNHGVYDVWIVKFSDITGVEKTREMQEVIVYPEIADDKIIIEYNGLSNNLHASIYSVSGQELIEQALNGNYSAIDISSLPTGMYFVKIDKADGPAIRKFIKR